MGTTTSVASARSNNECELTGMYGTPQTFTSEARANIAGQINDELAQGRPRELDDDGKSCQRNQQGQQTDPAADQVASQSKSQEAGNQDEILEIGEDLDLGRNPADHQQLEK